jgi:tetratricopeptide (TPR) repeat protein
MADDLRRFLEGQPILARRPSLRERAIRWSRRHRTTLGYTLAVFILGFAGLLAALVVLWREQDRTKAALTKAEEKEKEAQKERWRAERNLYRALSGASKMLMKLDPPHDDPSHIKPELRKQIMDRGLDFFQAFIEENSPDPAVRFQSSKAYEEISAVHCSLHEVTKSRSAMEKSFALLEALIAEFPERDEYRGELIHQRYEMGLRYRFLGHPQEAREQYMRAIQLSRLTADLDVSATTMNNCSWVLVDCPDETLRDPDLGVAFAEKAVTKDPEQGNSWNTLGVAYYRKGDWLKARTSLEQSMKLSKGGDPNDWFFLAMACQRLGDVGQARAWRDKASLQLDENEPKDENLLRYRAETDALLGRQHPEK